MNSQPDSRGLFPIHHAFVVQLAAEATLEGQHMRGRVEHVISRVATTFNSVEALLDFFKQVLSIDFDPEMVQYLESYTRSSTEDRWKSSPMPRA